MYEEDDNINTASFWQMPGMVRKELPLVPYESYNEYEVLTERLATEYTTMVKKGLEDNVSDSSLRPWYLAHYGLSWNVTRHWMRKGNDIFLKLTKGVGKEWCELMNVFLIDLLDTAVRIFVHTRLIGFGIHLESEFEGGMDPIGDLLECEIRRFIHHKEINPMMCYSLRRLNFILYYSDSSNHDMNDTNQLFMPTWKFQDIMAAFAMGRHARLGKNSLVGMLDDELTRLIFNFRLF